MESRFFVNMMFTITPDNNDLLDLNALHISPKNFSGSQEGLTWQDFIDFISPIGEMWNNQKIMCRVTSSVVSVLTNGQETGNWELIGVQPEGDYASEWRLQYFLYRGLENDKLYVGSLSEAGVVTCAVFNGTQLV